MYYEIFTIFHIYDVKSLKKCIELNGWLGMLHTYIVSVCKCIYNKLHKYTIYFLWDTWILRIDAILKH